MLQELGYEFGTWVRFGVEFRFELHFNEELTKSYMATCDRNGDFHMVGKRYCGLASTAAALYHSGVEYSPSLSIYGISGGSLGPKAEAVDMTLKRGGCT